MNVSANSFYRMHCDTILILKNLQKQNMRIGLTQLGTRCSDCPREPSKQLIVLESPVKAEAEFI